MENQKRTESISPEGESFPIPAQADYGPELERLKKLSDKARAEGKEVVVVVGVGFVGAVMAAIVADTVDKATGKPSKRSEEHTSELQSRPHLVCRLLLEKK